MPEFRAKYHNMRITFEQGASTHFLYARLAWAIFPLVKTFLISGRKRWVKVRVGDNDGNLTWTRCS